MDPPGPQPMRSRRYGIIMDPPPQLSRSAVDDLGSSIAAPPPDAFAVPVTQSKGQTFLAAMDEPGVLEDDGAWTDSDPETAPAVRDLLEEDKMSRRSFLTEMQGRGERAWLEELQEEFPNIRRVMVPTVDEEEDEEAPRTIPTAPHVRTVLQAMSAGTGPPMDEPLSEIPVTAATAAAMERLAHDDEETEPAPGPMERRKKTRSKAEYDVGPDGELVRKKKKKKDTTRKKKKRRDVEPPLDLRHEPLADLPQGLPSVDEPAESEWGAPMPFLDAVPRPADRGVHEPDVVPPTLAAPAPPSPTRSLAVTEAPAQLTPEQNRARVLNYNATRIAVNMYVVYWGMLVMLRRLWRWENPWLTGGTALFYAVVWWRGDLLAVGFLLAVLYVATFRLWLTAPAADESREPAPPSALLRHGVSLGLVTTTPSREMLQQVSDQVLVVTHGLADVQERMKNLLLWRSPMVTLRYLGWLLLLSLLSMQATSWMLLRVPGALLFLLVFVLAPLIEYGHWYKLVELLCDVTGAERPRHDAPYATTRSMLDNVLAGVPTDEEFLQEKLQRTHWEAERELRRRGQWIEPLNRIVEEMDVHRANLSGWAPQGPHTAQRQDESHGSPRHTEGAGIWAESTPLHSSVRAPSAEPPAVPPPQAPAMPVHEPLADDTHSVSDYGTQAESMWEVPEEPAPAAPEPAVMLSPGLPWSTVLPTTTPAAAASETGAAPLSPEPLLTPAPPITSLSPLQPAELEPRADGPFTPPAPLGVPAAAATSVAPDMLTTPASAHSALRREVAQPDLDADARPEPAVAPTSPPWEPSPRRKTEQPLTPALHASEPVDGVYLAVHRRRLGHLLVLPTRVAFLLSYSPRRPESVPGLTASQVLSLSRTVDGRVFYPTMTPRGITAVVRDEMRGRGRASLVPASGTPRPNQVLFDVPIAQVTGLKKLRKTLPLLDECHEGLELVLASGPGLSMPAVVGRDAAFERVLSVDPARWP